MRIPWELVFLASIGTAHATPGTDGKGAAADRGGFVLGAGLGMHAPIGPFYDGDFTNDLAWKLDIGWRLGRFIAPGVSVWMARSDVRGVDVPVTSYGREAVVIVPSAELRVFPMGGGRFEPVALVGYSPVVQTVVGEEYLNGSGFTLGAGARFRPHGKIYVDGELRYLVLRYENDTDSLLPPGKKNDPADHLSVMVGAGLQF